MTLAQNLVGVTLAGKYVLRRLLGVGGMGAVYEGFHIEIGKRVAVKVISMEGGPLPDAEERFRREARAASAVESEHIVQVFDVGQDAAAGLYMVMEFLTGEDLASYLAREGKLGPEMASILMQQVARALSKAHDAGVVHRDLKPANIFLTARDDGSLHVKVLDFGVSKLLRDESNSAYRSALTRTGSVLGTPQYMAPEQAQGLPTVDRRADVWSAGAVLYECLAGVPAYPDLPTYEQMIIHIATRPPALISDVAPWVPAPLAALIHRAMTHDLGERIPDCLTFAKVLRDAVPVGNYVARPSFRAPNPSLTEEAGGTARTLLATSAVAASGGGLAPGLTSPGLEMDGRPRGRRRVALWASLGAVTLALAGLGTVGISALLHRGGREAAAAPQGHVSRASSPARSEPLALPAPEAPPTLAAAPTVAPREVTPPVASAVSEVAAAAPGASRKVKRIPVAKAVEKPPPGPSAAPPPAPPDAKFGGVILSDQY